MFDLNKIRAFLQDGSNPKPANRQDVHFLNGYKWNTLLGYNAAVKKYLKFSTASKRVSFSLPISPEELYNFCYWAGRVLNEPTVNDISSATLAKYLFGLQAWHLYHRKKYPDLTKPTITVLLRSSAHADAELSARPKKEAIHIRHLVLLAQTLANGNQFHKALLDLTLIAFWGMARLSEVTYDTSEGTLRRSSSVLASDASFEALPNSVVGTLAIRGAKTCFPGSVQCLVLHATRNMLCPVRALLRRVSDTKDKNTSLFGYYDEKGTRVHLTKTVVCKTLSALWSGLGCTGLSGHSFRVGGASYRHAMGIPIERIQSLG
ncbi:hypothetical protein MJO28_014879 [Puccinia striiformis f. sp. tritici]|uniref:Tyr recombinase domain-containing protein n=2 Tax=Puccinia striiformis f. sp. tritici TaxID=168172 RepID=A0A0L0VEB4_9BASI|nr:hypothetical protein MJO28_014879 [Puccinia striiformis f. sp. tritici]KNE97615.1 hypothetical protein PSTG_09164 [Puccinia striiformis f. sp. tritici PST-78]